MGKKDSGFRLWSNVQANSHSSTLSNQVSDSKNIAIKMEPVADISDIMITPEEQNNRFVDIKQSSKKLLNLESQSFVKIFYGKKTMRELLDERTNLCLQLQLSSKKSSERQQLDKEAVACKFSQLFSDCPDKLNELSWAVIQDKGAVYGFLATQNKFAPLCKSCNHAIYISMRFNLGRVVCGNPKCRIKLLGEFEIGGKLQNGKREGGKNQLGSAETLGKYQLVQTKNLELQLGAQEKEMIKKAAKRILN